MLVEITKLKEGEFLTVTSRDVAEDFGKRHDNVVRDIENLILGLGSPQNSVMFMSRISKCINSIF